MLSLSFAKWDKLAKKNWEYSRIYRKGKWTPIVWSKNTHYNYEEILKGGVDPQKVTVNDWVKLIDSGDIEKALHNFEIVGYYHNQYHWKAIYEYNDTRPEYSKKKWEELTGFQKMMFYFFNKYY